MIIVFFRLFLINAAANDQVIDFLKIHLLR
jgi:hypothetical protein